MNTASIVLKLVVIIVVNLVAVAALFLFNKFIDKKLKGPDSSIWRWRVGVANCILAGIVFFTKGHYLSVKGFLNSIISLGIVILALVGIGDIIIALLNIASANKKSKISAE